MKPRPGQLGLVQTRRVCCEGGRGPHVPRVPSRAWLRNTRGLVRPGHLQVTDTGYTAEEKLALAEELHVQDIARLGQSDDICLSDDYDYQCLAGENSTNSHIY